MKTRQRSRRFTAHPSLAKRMSPRTQQGSIIPMVALGTLVMVGVAGLSLDSGHAFVNKTRLQNSLDASALASAKNLDLTHSQARAQEVAKEVFTQALGQSANSELGEIGIDSNDLTIQFSNTRSPFIPHPAATRYVRVSLRKGVAQVDTWFMRVAGVDALDLSGSAVAGPSPTLGKACNLLPTLICGDATKPPNDAGLYGYNYGTTVALILGKPGGPVGPGNFQIAALNGERGGDDTRKFMAGDESGCLSPTGTVETEPGQKTGPVQQGTNTRFGLYSGPVNSTDYPPDLVTDAGPAGYPDTYAQYQADYASKNWDAAANGLSLRRIAPIIVADCSNPIHGRDEVPVLGLACAFLTEPVTVTGPKKDERLNGQLIKECNAKGTPGPAPGVGTGLHTIQLYGDPDRWDS